MRCQGLVVRVAMTALAMSLNGRVASAQIGRWFTLGAGATDLRVQSRAATGVTSELTGIAVGGEGELALGPVALEVGYRQGPVEADAAGAVRRDVIEGRALLAVRAVGWFAVKAGPQVRSYVTTAGTERWVFWQARVRVEHTIVEPSVRGYVEVWRALSTEVNAPQPVERGYGGEVGLTVRVARGPLWVRLVYGIDDARLSGSARRETVEALALTVGFGGR